MTNTAICRIVQQQDTRQVKALWQQCFDDTPAFVQWYFDRYYKAENTLGIFERDILLASAQVIPYAVNLRGKTMDCGYVVGVDTAPEARNRGYARTLLKNCLELQRQRRQPISLLMPFEGQFYYRYGWPFCYFHQQIKIKPQELRCAAREWGIVRQVNLFDRDTIKALQRIYDGFKAIYNGCVKRSEENWQLLLEDAALEQSKCYLIEYDGQAEGYCLWTPIEDTVLIREMAWSSEPAKAGLLQFLMQTVPKEQTLWLELPADDALVYQLAVSKTAVVQYPFLMARIVDVKQCLEALDYPVWEQPVSFQLSVKDSFAHWNNAVFDILIKDGQASVTSAEKNKPNSIEITIEALSQLVMGARRADQLQRQSPFQVSDDALWLLQQLWPEQQLYINEYY